MLKLDVDLDAAFAELDDISDKAGGAVKRAVFRGAWVIRLEAEARAPMSEKAHWFYSRRRKDGTPGQRYLFQPGSLKKSIYIKHLEEASVAGVRESYKIGWRENSSNKGYVPYAHMVEFGTVRTPAFPFIRPAYDAKRKQAESLVVETIRKAVYGTQTD